MPLYNFSCKKCGKAFKKLYSVDAFSKAVTVCACGETATHVPGAASFQSMEVIDNGIMPQRLERYSEAERIFKEREIAWDKKYGEKKDDE